MTGPEEPDGPTEDPGGDGLEAPPPLLGSWRNLYALVLGWLALQVVVYWTITQVYAP